MPYKHTEPLCPDCKKKGIISYMRITKLEGIWLCKKCNHTMENI